MHHVVLERWSRGRSFLHARDPRAKTAAVLIFLIVLATTHERLPAVAALFFALLIAALLVARLPVLRMLARAAVVLPFTLAFAAITLLGGEPARAGAFLVKSYLSALAVLALVATTPIHKLLRGLESIRVPLFLLMVAQFLYRYLFVIAEEAQHMRAAAAARGGGLMARRAGRKAAAGALAVLFSRSFARSSRIHRAMVARGFMGHYRLLGTLRFTPADGIFLALAAGLCVVLRAAAGAWS